jgi:hypothetical protein
MEANNLQTSLVVLEYLKLFISWPFLLFSLLIIFRKGVSSAIERISQRMKSAGFMGSKIEFASFIEGEGEIVNALEKIKQHDANALIKVGLDEEVYKIFREKVKERIRYVQEFLKKRGDYTGDVDGIAGKDTKSAVRKFQTESGLPADGLIGPRTVKKILEIQQNASADK